MSPNSLYYALSLFATAALTAGLGLYTVRSFRRLAEHPSAVALGWLMAAVTEWTLAYALELLWPTLAGKILAAKLQYVGITAVGPLWLAFAMRYTQRGHLLTRRNQVLLAIIPAITLALAATNESHHFIWTGLALDPSGFPGLLVTGRGAWFWIFTLVAYIYTLSGIGLYLVTFARAARLYRRQVGIIVAVSLVPLAGNAIYLSGLFPVRGLDLTPFGFSISAVLLVLGLARFGLINLRPIAAQVVMEHLRDAVVVVDARNRLIDLNPAARKLLGFGEEAFGQNVFDLLPKTDDIRKYSDIIETQAELESGEGESKQWFELTISALTDSRGQLMGRVALLRDITHERALSKMRDDLTNMIVHDLHNPLSAIHTALELIESPVGGAEPMDASDELSERQEAVTIALDSVTRAERMLDNLLDVTRLESGQMPVSVQETSIEDTARAVIREMNPTAEKRGLSLVLEAPLPLPPAAADPQLLDRILRNLIGNAIKFTPKGGQITVSAHGGDQDILMAVSDTGPGLSLYVQAHLFEKFVRGADREHGHGLGLAFCKLAVQAMGGRIWAESGSAKDTTFSFTLPIFKGGTTLA